MKAREERELACRTQEEENQELLLILTKFAKYAIMEHNSEKTGV
jgi:hypothetical protein